MTLRAVWVSLLLACASVSASNLLAGCPPLPPRPQLNTIQDLRPNSVKVIMTLGDSFVSGYGIVNENEHRGLVFCAGGDENATTVPNFFAQFSPSIVGASTSSHEAEICSTLYCPNFQYSPSDGLNGGHSGALISDIANTEINYLVQELNQMKGIDINNDWKVLTIVVGADDLCRSCTYGRDFTNGDEYKNNLMGVLERIRLNIPRTFVNLVPIYTYTGARMVAMEFSQCASKARTSYINCDCIFPSNATTVRGNMDQLVLAYNSAITDVASYYETRNYNTFWVAVQPFLQNGFTAPSYHSPVDCFHVSKKGHEAMAIALWNAMLTPRANKKKEIDPSDTPICPGPDTLIYTF